MTVNSTIVGPTAGDDTATVTETGASTVSKVAPGSWARWRVGLGLLALAGIAAACGSGGSSDASGKASTPTSSGKAGTSQVLGAHDLNLVASDLPDSWKEAPNAKGPDVVRSSINKCLLQAPGAVPPSTSATSANFVDRSNGQQVGSQVQIYGTPEQAASAARDAGSEGVSACLESQVSTALPSTLPSEETLRHATVAGNSVPGLATGEFSQQVVALVTYPTGTTGSGGSTLFIDVVGFASGPNLVQAEFESTGSAPPEALERSTMSALMARAAGK